MRSPADMDATDWSSLLSQHNRLLQVQTVLPDALVVERWEGLEAINEELAFTLDCISPCAVLDLARLPGTVLCLQLAQLDGQPRSWQGTVISAEQHDSDGGIAHYRLHIGTWLSLLKPRRNTRIFQDLDALEIVTRIFADYPQAQWEARVTQLLPRRALCTQYRETDYEFVCRLLSEEGLSFYFEHAANAKKSARLVIIDRDYPWPDGGTLSFSREDTPQADDGIRRLSEQRQISSDTATTCAWNPEQLLGLSGSADDAISEGPVVPELEVYEAIACAIFHAQNEAHLAATHLLSARRLSCHGYEGDSATRPLQLGVRYTLDHHPQLGALPLVCRQIRHVATNNLGLPLAHRAGQPELEQGLYNNHFLAAAPTVPIVPDRLPRPQAPGVQTATVVGVPKHTLTSNRDHQVRVQFFWQRGESPLPGGLQDNAHAPGNETSGTWVRVAEALAGANFGQHFTPRIGSEVLISYAHADIDQPVVIAQVYNGDATAPFSAGIDAAANHPGTISGVQTVALDGQPASHWQLDDAQGQLRQQLGNETARSSLTLGYAIASEGSKRSIYQGLGFHQTTQGWGQVRAAEGLLLSASLQTGAKATQMQMSDALDQLYGAVNTAERLSQAAQQAQAGIMATHAGQQALADELNPRKGAQHPAQVNGQSTTQRDNEQAVERFSSPHMVLETPDHLTSATPASSAVYAGQQIQVTSQQELHLSAAHSVAGVSGGNLQWYTAKGGAKIVAQTAAISLQAHTDRMEVLADQAATFTASAGRIDLIAKTRIVLQAGSASITLQGGDITFACPGQFSVKGSEHPLLGGAKHTLNLDVMSQSQGATELAFILKDTAGAPLPEIDQILDIRAGDLRSRAISDATAQTRRHFSAQPEPAQVHLSYPQIKVEDDSF
ncbi:type VI secretion system Vgr family protein [Pseudomonas sp. NBRC 111138]|uniref:type VI secretion system Vgr family protein n=1 Tax=Pseudomonas sp. NBRC 111138 TaxID=1661053 RepID=UPI0006D44EB1|nr:type VI secretion system Vgr family protein [Pseudomonas sp. NBRC 111138]